MGDSLLNTGAETDFNDTCMSSVAFKCVLYVLNCFLNDFAQYFLSYERQTLKSIHVFRFISKFANGYYLEVLIYKKKNLIYVLASSTRWQSSVSIGLGYV